MTEAEWLAGTDPVPMLEFASARFAARKFRLFACECCRRIWDLVPDENLRRAIQIVESVADGRSSELMLPELWGKLRWGGRASWHASQAYAHTTHVMPQGARLVIDHIAACVTDAGAEATEQCRLLREIFGNLCQSTVFSPEWRTDTSILLASQMYDSREFSAMPILADALQDAGCDSHDILAHCRGPGEHVRGCWVVDLVLGKS